MITGEKKRFEKGGGQFWMFIKKNKRLHTHEKTFNAGRVGLYGCLLLLFGGNIKVYIL